MGNKGETPSQGAYVGGQGAALIGEIRFALKFKFQFHFEVDFLYKLSPELPGHLGNTQKTWQVQILLKYNKSLLKPFYYYQ